MRGSFSYREAKAEAKCSPAFLQYKKCYFFVQVSARDSLRVIKVVEPTHLTEEYENDEGALARAKSFRNGMYAREISACAVRAVVKIGNYVFVHGGINKEVIIIDPSHPRLEN